MVHTFDNDNASLSEGALLAVVVRDFPETPHQKWDNTDFPRLMRQSKARLRLVRPPLARRGSAPHERVLVVGATLYLSEKDLARIIA